MPGYQNLLSQSHKDGYEMVPDDVLPRTKAKAGFPFMPFLWTKKRPSMGTTVFKVRGKKYLYMANGGIKFAIEQARKVPGAIVAASVNEDAFVCGTWQPCMIYLVLNPIGAMRPIDAKAEATEENSKTPERLTSKRGCEIHD